jgi:two-component system nitrogen regulation response regulator NtrX
MAKEKILVVDDELGVRKTLTSILEDEGYSADSVETGEACLESARSLNYQAILLDIWLPGIDGIETLKALRNLGSESAVIMISGHGTIETAVKATKLGAFDFIEKPLSLEKTILVLRNAIRHKKLLEKHKILEEELRKDTTLIGESKEASKLREDIEQAAPTGAPVLITGENGSGKELVARMIHFKSPRSEEALIALNCGALEEEVLRYELFGYEKGAFSWAVKSKKGKLEMAHEGTLFLDNIDAVSAEIQFKLYKTLEERSYEAYGSEKKIRTDVRIISSAESSLEEAVKQDKFLKETFFKISVIALTIPPLRQRKEDIHALAGYFLNGFSHEYGKSPKKLSPKGVDVLKSYPWPGNVRELKNIMERVAIMVQEEVIEPQHLTVLLRPSPISETAEDAPRFFQALHPALYSYEKNYIENVLKSVQNNMEKASKILKLDLSALKERMKFLGIDV